MINYDFQEMDKIKGKKSSEFSEILGFVREDEIIHKDNLVRSRNFKPFEEGIECHVQTICRG